VHFVHKSVFLPLYCLFTKASIVVLNAAVVGLAPEQKLVHSGDSWNWHQVGGLSLEVGHDFLGRLALRDVALEWKVPAETFANGRCYKRKSVSSLGTDVLPRFEKFSVFPHCKNLSVVCKDTRVYYIQNKNAHRESIFGTFFSAKCSVITSFRFYSENLASAEKVRKNRPHWANVLITIVIKY
jgi:hypothetical protein